MFDPLSLPEYTPTLTPESLFTLHPKLLETAKSELDDYVRAGNTIDRAFICGVIDDQVCKVWVCPMQNAAIEAFAQSENPLDVYNHVMTVLNAVAEPGDEVEDDIDAINSMLVTIGGVRWNHDITNGESDKFNDLVAAQLFIVATGIMKCFPQAKTLGVVFKPESVEIETGVFSKMVAVDEVVVLDESKTVRA